MHSGSRGTRADQGSALHGPFGRSRRVGPLGNVFVDVNRNVAKSSIHGSWALPEIGEADTDIGRFAGSNIELRRDTPDYPEAWIHVGWNGEPGQDRCSHCFGVVLVTVDSGTEVAFSELGNPGGDVSSHSRGHGITAFDVEVDK